MNSRLSTILAFLLASFLAVTGVELFYQNLEKRLQTGEKVNAVVTVPKHTDKKPKKTTQTKTIQKSVRKQPTRKTDSPPKKSGNDYSIISKRKLFGAVKQEKESTTKPEKVLTTTSLDLILLGTVTGDDDVQRAIILDKKARSQDLYYNGDAVGPALIKEVKRGKVILTIDGRDEILLMQEPKSIQSKGGRTSQVDNLSTLIDKYINIPEDEQKRIRTKPIAGKSRSRKITFKRPQKQEFDQ